MPKANIPTYDALMNPLIQALKSLGGSGTVEEITNKVAEIAGLTDEQLELIHDPDKGGMTEIDLVDGEQFLDKLKELGLGVKTRKVEVEEISVEHEWFASI